MHVTRVEAYHDDVGGVDIARPEVAGPIGWHVAQADRNRDTRRRPLHQLECSVEWPRVEILAIWLIWHAQVRRMVSVMIARSPQNNSRTEVGCSMCGMKGR